MNMRLRLQMGWISICLLACLPTIVNAQSVMTPRERACSAVTAATNVTGNRVHDTICGLFGKFVGKACELANPYPDFGDHWKNCVVCVLDDTCDENWGDPHFVTGDGLRFDFQGEGDFAVVEAGDLEVQARYEGANATIQTGVAVRAGQTVVAVENTNSDTAPIFINGQPVNLANGDWYEFDAPTGYVQRLESTTRIVFDNRVAMVIEGSQLTMRVDAALSATRRGLFGNGNGDPRDDLQTPDGTPVDAGNFEQLYGAFQEGWRRTGSDSLFSTPFVLSPTNRADVVPTLASFDAGARAQALQQCLARGVRSGAGLDECVYDILVTGNEDLVDAALAAQTAAAQSVSAIGLTSLAEPPISLSDLGQVGAGLPSAGAGNLGRTFEVDQYQVQVLAGAARAIRGISPCNDGRSLSMLIANDNGEQQEEVLDCGSLITLQAGANALAVFSAAGDSGDYGFEIIEPPVTDIGIIEENQPYEGTLGTDIVRGTLNAQPGTVVYLAALANSSCDANWRIVNSLEAITETRPACEDIGIATLTGSAPHQIEITPIRENVTYQFLMTLHDAPPPSGNPEIPPEQPTEPAPEVEQQGPTDEPVVINTGVVTLDADDEAPAGGFLSATWSGPFNSGDYLSVAVPGSPGVAYDNFRFATADANSVELRAPALPGNYEVRYVSSDDVILASRGLRVLPVTATVSSVQQAEIGSEVNIQWMGPGNQGDYITVARPEALGVSYEFFRYTTDDSNQVALRMPADEGIYEIRYVLGYGDRIIGRQNIQIVGTMVSLNSVQQAEIGSEVEVQWSGPANQGDYITVAQPDALGSSYEFFRYTSTDSDRVILRMPAVEGTYEIRYVLGVRDRIITRQNIQVVGTTASLTIPPMLIAGTTQTIQYTGPANNGDYITIAVPGSAGNQYESFRFASTDSDTVSLRMPDAPGTYEIRYVLGVGDRIITSTTVQVSAAKTGVMDVVGVER